MEAAKDFTPSGESASTRMGVSVPMAGTALASFRFTRLPANQTKPTAMMMMAPMTASTRCNIWFELSGLNDSAALNTIVGFEDPRDRFRINFVLFRQDS